MPDREGLILGQIPYCTELNSSQMPGYPRGMPGGGMGGFGIDWYIITETVSVQKIISDVMTISIPFVLNKPKISTGQVIVSY